MCSVPRVSERFAQSNALDEDIARLKYVSGKREYILKDQRLLTLNAKAAHLLKQIPETDSPYVFLNPKTGAPYKLHEFYYLHKKILKQARLPWVAFRDLQRQCMEVGI